jgi:Family of unknown function (DUF6367)
VDVTYLILEVDANTLAEMRLEESVWKRSQYPDYFYRVDPARPEMRQQRHIHIAHKKHVNSPSQQVSWNSDQTRHDQHTFADHFKGLEKAKEIARTALKLGDDAVLESVPDHEKARLLIEAVAGDSEFSTSELLDMPILVLKWKPLAALKRVLQRIEKMERDDGRSQKRKL